MSRIFCFVEFLIVDYFRLGYFYYWCGSFDGLLEFEMSVGEVCYCEVLLDGIIKWVL